MNASKLRGPAPKYEMRSAPPSIVRFFMNIRVGSTGDQKLCMRNGREGETRRAAPGRNAPEIPRARRVHPAAPSRQTGDEHTRSRSAVATCDGDRLRGRLPSKGKAHAEDQGIGRRIQSCSEPKIDRRVLRDKDHQAAHDVVSRSVGYVIREPILLSKGFDTPSNLNRVRNTGRRLERRSAGVVHNAIVRNDDLDAVSLVDNVPARIDIHTWQNAARSYSCTPGRNRHLWNDGNCGYDAMRRCESQLHANVRSPAPRAIVRDSAAWGVCRNVSPARTSNQSANAPTLRSSSANVWLRTAPSPAV